jgi:hypothetical protein
MACFERPSSMDSRAISPKIETVANNQKSNIHMLLLLRKQYSMFFEVKNLLNIHAVV